MSGHEMRQILEVVRYYMSPTLRRMVMLEAPRAYNAWFKDVSNEPIVKVVNASGEDIS